MRRNKRFQWQQAVMGSLLMVGVVATQSACAQRAGAPSGPPADRSLAELDAELRKTNSDIQREVGDAIADDRSQCAVLPLGKKPCGGPSSYLIYSQRVSDSTRLKKLADRYTELQDARNKLTGAISNCMIEPVPDAVIVDGKCRASYDKKGIPQ